MDLVESKESETEIRDQVGFYRCQQNMMMTWLH